MELIRLKVMLKIRDIPPLGTLRSQINYVTIHVHKGLAAD